MHFHPGRDRATELPVQGSEDLGSCPPAATCWDSGQVTEVPQVPNSKWQQCHLTVVRGIQAQGL